MNRIASLRIPVNKLVRRNIYTSIWNRSDWGNT